MRRASPSQAGFSLVEVALALLVASVGLMAVLALFPAGLDLSKKAQDDTQLSLFADEVLNGLRAISTSTNVPWSAIVDQPSLRIPISGEKESTASQQNFLWDAGSTRFVEAGGGLKPYSLKTLQNPLIEEIVLRYELRIVDQGPEIKQATLRVLPGQVGAITNAYVFMTEFHRWDSKP